MSVLYLNWDTWQSDPDSISSDDDYDESSSSQNAEKRKMILILILLSSIIFEFHLFLIVISCFYSVPNLFSYEFTIIMCLLRKEGWRWWISSFLASSPLMVHAGRLCPIHSRMSSSSLHVCLPLALFFFLLFLLVWCSDAPFDMAKVFCFFYPYFFEKTSYKVISVRVRYP